MSGVRLPRPVMRDDVRRRLRAALVNEAVALAEERRAGRASLARRVASWWTEGRLRPVVVAATLVALLVAGAGTAAAGSLPGDPTFVLKQAAEQIELAVAPTDEAKVQVLATQAQRRLDELERASTERPERAPTASAAYQGAVQRFAAAVQAVRAATPGSKHEAVERLVDAAHDKHIEVLEQLKDRLPEPAQHEIERAIEEHEKLSPGKPDRPRPSEHPGVAPTRPGETDRPRATATDRPRATETPRGSRPTATATSTPAR